MQSERPNAPSRNRSGNPSQQPAELSTANSIISSLHDSPLDGILAVDNFSRILYYNRQFAAMWSLPEELISENDDNRILEFALRQVAEPASYIARVHYLYSHPKDNAVKIFRKYKD